MKLFLQKKCKDLRASGGWGLCPQTPSLRRLGALPPDPHWPPVAGGSAPRPPKQLPHCEFLATRLAVCDYFWSDGGPTFGSAEMNDFFILLRRKMDPFLALVSPREFHCRVRSKVGEKSTS